MTRTKWFSPGDIDGFFGLMIDNLIQILVLSALCTVVCGFSPDFVFGTVLPGVAVSLLVGNLFYSWQAVRLMESENRDDVTALPYGINTVSLFAFIFFIIMPVYQKTGDFRSAWQVGILASFLSGLIEIAGAFFAGFIRKNTPRAALLSALAGIAMTFIAMDFLFRTFQYPLIAFIPFAIILLQYFGKVKFPFDIPGGLLAVVLGTILAWSAGLWQEPMMDSRKLLASFSFISLKLPGFFPTELFGALALDDIGKYLAVIIPMGIFNVLGSLQNIESAEAAGDSFSTRDSMLVNGAGTIIGAFFGSPFPTTIYIGHPGWKALGARAGYSVLNGIFITLVCLLGLTGMLQNLIPVEAGMAIVLWIGIVIGAQSFDASPRAHGPAIIIGILPALAGWAILIIQSSFNYANMYLSGLAGKNSPAYTILLENVPQAAPVFPYQLGGIISLSQGFLLTSMIWAAITVFIIERDFIKSAIWSFIAAGFSATGIIHAYRLEGNNILNEFAFLSSPEFVIAYLLLGAALYTTGKTVHE